MAPKGAANHILATEAQIGNPKLSNTELSKSTCDAKLCSLARVDGFRSSVV